MDYYVLAATAIPALWVATGLLHQSPSDPRSAALGRTALRLTLAAGEVSAVTAVAVGHDGYLSAIAATLALIVGAAVAVGRYSATDLARLGIPHELAIGAGVFLLMVVVAYATYR